jgi:3-oxo-5alpha-steroid 4-dehydrogenase
VHEVAGWTDEADVVVVGFGCAGAAAAITAAERGRDVVVLERTSGPGGASAMSGGELYLGGGTPVQKSCGFDDDPEEMAKYLVAACGPYADADRIRTYAEGSVEHFHWLEDSGLEFRHTHYSEPTVMPDTEDGLIWLGENSYPFNEIARPVPRGHRPATRGHGGWLLMERLAARAKKAGVRSRTDVTVDRLVVDTDGTVVGVEGRSFGEAIVVHARRGVVLAGGGFVYNDTMLERFAPRLLGHGKIGTEGDDGSAIQLACAAGAAVRRMEAGNASLMVPLPMLLPSMLVNRHAQRFINEDTYFGRIGQHALFHHDAQVHLILDGQTYDSIPDAERMGIKPAAVCDTVDELEATIGFPSGSLVASVRYYNEHAATGEDPVFHKARRWMRPLEAPFGAVDLVPKPRLDGSFRSRFWVFTLGGLHTGIDGEVLDLGGRPIPGLFAAGRTTSGLQAWGYISGTSLGDGTFFGRRAGRALS